MSRSLRAPQYSVEKRCRKHQEEDRRPSDHYHYAPATYAPIQNLYQTLITMARHTRLLFTIFAAIALLSCSVRAANDSLYFLYQRTPTLEPFDARRMVGQPCLDRRNYRANRVHHQRDPARVFVYACVREIPVPFLKHFGAGIGIMGTGIAPDQSTQITSAGANYNSQFTFPTRVFNWIGEECPQSQRRHSGRCWSGNASQRSGRFVEFSYHAGRIGILTPISSSAYLSPQPRWPRIISGSRFTWMTMRSSDSGRPFLTT